MKRGLAHLVGPAAVALPPVRPAAAGPGVLDATFWAAGVATIEAAAAAAAASANAVARGDAFVASLQPGGALDPTYGGVTSAAGGAYQGVAATDTLHVFA